jgi:chaperone BCS1
MSELIRAFLAAHLHNTVFAGGLGLGLVGAITAAVACLPYRIRWLFVRYGTVSVQIDNQSDLFDHMMAWLNAHPYAGGCRRLSARIIETGDDDGVIQFVPAPGWHWLFHARRVIWLVRDEPGVPAGRPILGSGNRPEKVTLRMLGRNTDPLRKLIERIRSDYGKADPDYLKVYAANGHDEWQKVARVRKRSLQSVILKESLIDDIVVDVRRFLAAETWYAERGVPWRRGYLLYGPPGTGKTSLIRALAGAFDRDLALLDIASDRLDDIKLATLMAEVPERCVIVLEDIDAAFNGRTSKDAGKGITFSGLLNALDGILSQEGRVLFMTTNHPERLDPALVRPGRVDRKYELGLATGEQILQHYKLYFPEASAEEAERFLGQLKDRPSSPATVQEILLNRMAPG